MLTIPVRLSADQYSALEQCPLPPDRSRLAGIRSHAGPIAPNIREWAAGDIVISRPLKRPSGVDALQRLMRPSKDASWTHVGVYDGDGFIWDANPKIDVQERSVGDYMLTKSSVRVVRSKNIPRGITDLRHVLNQLASLSYDVPAAIRTMLKPDGRGEEAEGGIVCSTFVERVYRHAFRCQLFRTVALPLPVDFLDHPDFAVVPTRWLRRQHTTSSAG